MSLMNFLSGCMHGNCLQTTCVAHPSRRPLRGLLRMRAFARTLILRSLEGWAMIMTTTDHRATLGALPAIAYYGRYWS